MSVWTDIHKRSNGSSVRKEDQDNTSLTPEEKKAIEDITYWRRQVMQQKLEEEERMEKRMFCLKIFCLILVLVLNILVLAMPNQITVTLMLCADFCLLVFSLSRVISYYIYDDDF